MFPPTRSVKRLDRAARRRWLNLDAVPLLARISLVVLFPFSALDKIVHWNAALRQADSSIVPKALGPGMLVAAAAVELVTPVCIIGRRYDRAAAIVLAGFCTVTAVLFHPFWRYRGFWSPGEKEGNAHFWDFLKNFGLVGGLLLLAISEEFISASRVVEHPLTSTPRGARPGLGRRARRLARGG